MIPVYPELEMWFKQRLLDQRVVTRRLGYYFVTHPNLRAKLQNMWSSGFLVGQNTGVRRPKVETGLLHPKKMCLIQWGLGVRVSGGAPRLRHSLVKKLEWAGFVVVNKKGASFEMAIPKETIFKWIAEGTFVSTTNDVNYGRVRKVLSTVPEMAPVALAMRGMLGDSLKVKQPKGNRDRRKVYEHRPKGTTEWGTVEYAKNVPGTVEDRDGGGA